MEQRLSAKMFFKTDPVLASHNVFYDSFLKHQEPSRETPSVRRFLHAKGCG